MGGYKSRRQQGIGEYIADFYCSEKKLAIEIDGDSHFLPIEEMHDRARSKYFELLGTKILRFTNTEIYKNKEQVLEKIIETLDNHP